MGSTGNREDDQTTRGVLILLRFDTNAKLLKELPSHCLKAVRKRSAPYNSSRNLRGNSEHQISATFVREGGTVLCDLVLVQLMFGFLELHMFIFFRA